MKMLYDQVRDYAPIADRNRMKMLIRFHVTIIVGLAVLGGPFKFS